jgi:ABC-2 type transport system ATP-binding protein
MLEIENLTKTFGTQTVISDISMTLVSGKIYGLVGRNGSGKTMLMKMILGFVSPSSGSIKIEGKVLGKDISMPDRIGAIIENPGFLPEYSGFKNLKFLAMIHHKISNEEIRNAMRIVGLEKAAELLTVYGQSPSTAGISVGYPDLYHFSKIFKKHFGVSPREYQKLNI